MQGFKNPAGFLENPAGVLTLTIFFNMMTFIFLVIIIYVLLPYVCIFVF